MSVLLTVFAACVNEQYPQPDDISAVPEGMITVDEAKIYFFRHSDGSVSALNRDRLYLQNAFFAVSGGDTAGVLTKTFATSSRSGLPLWEEAVVIVNPKYSTLRVPLSENVSGISRIGFGDDKNRIEYREARTRSSLIVQMLHEDGRIRQYVETVIRSDRSLTGDSYVLITDVAGEFLWCDRWKNGKRTDMALVGSSLPSSASADSQKLLLYGISLRSIWTPTNWARWVFRHVRVRVAVTTPAPVVTVAGTIPASAARRATNIRASAGSVRIAAASSAMESSVRRLRINPTPAIPAAAVQTVRNRPVFRWST